MLSPRAPAVPMGLQVSALPLPQAPRVGLEPTTTRLTAECSTIELSRIILSLYPQNRTLLLFHLPMIFHPLPCGVCFLLLPSLSDNSCTSLTFWISPRPISTYQLSTLLHLHLKPIYLVVFKGSYTCVGISHLEGGFTLRCLQRLSLPDLATLPWHWLPTGTPVVRPSRSSRTKDSSSQISYAHAG